MKKSVIILLHVGYWILYILLVTIMLMPIWLQFSPESISVVGFAQYIIYSPLGICAFIPGIASFYLFYNLLFDRLLNKRKIALLILFGFTTCIIVSLFSDFLLTILIGRNTLYSDGFASAISITIILFFIALIHGIIGLVMKGFISFYSDIKLKEDLNRKNHEMELALVKNQLNPHFLFNTINNIDVLIEKDAAKASQYLNKLSDILRFMLYEIKTEKIAFEKEITYIEKYIELQRIRTSNSHFINYSIIGDTQNIVISPMLFIPFIENAFKYSENKQIENAIRIYFEVDSDQIIFICENYFNTNANNPSEFTGLGNILIRKRLQLLYPNKHQIEITKIDKFYKVHLIIFRNEN